MLVFEERKNMEYPGNTYWSNDMTAPSHQQTQSTGMYNAKSRNERLTYLAPDCIRSLAHATGSKNSALNIGAKSGYSKLGG